ncbi:MAG: type II secretion system protein GspK, partial [Candidatus Omnitrophica bacterium]|nr:type II secretion system protein GspK [Candidatus Omnitrophota bacterium]
MKILFDNKEGQVLIVVVTVLTMLFVTGIAFFVFSQAERNASIRYLDSLRARYIAEGGVVYAQRILELDKQDNLIDSLEDISFRHFVGKDIDLDGDTQPESRWLEVLDEQGSTFGRFGVRIVDEAAKINLNTCEVQSLMRLFSQLGIDSSKADSVVASRPLKAVEQLGSILSQEEFRKIKDFVSVYSQEAQLDLEKKRRAYLNSVSSQIILDSFLARGISDAYQKAANLKDAVDNDLAQTVFYQYGLGSLRPMGISEPGDWVNRGTYYEATAQAQGRAATFVWSNLSIEDGDYFCFFYGNQDTDIVGQINQQVIFSGQAIKEKVRVQNGSFSVSISPVPNQTSRFSYVELVSVAPKRGLNRKIITGTEALVINELMVRPAQELLIVAQNILPGQSFSYTYRGIRPGDYYVVVLAEQPGGMVGEVYINGKGSTTTLYDGQYFPFSVNTQGSLTVEVKNHSLNTTTFRGIKILQQPDAEFIEILNLSSQEFDLSDFALEVYSLDGELIPGWPAKIPSGTKIKP